MVRGAGVWGGKTVCCFRGGVPRCKDFVIGGFQKRLKKNVDQKKTRGIQREAFRGKKKKSKSERKTKTEQLIQRETSSTGKGWPTSPEKFFWGG